MTLCAQSHCTRTKHSSVRARPLPSPAVRLRTRAIEYVLLFLPLPAIAPSLYKHTLMLSHWWLIRGARGSHSSSLPSLTQKIPSGEKNLEKTLAKFPKFINIGSGWLPIPTKKIVLIMYLLISCPKFSHKLEINFLNPSL